MPRLLATVCPIALVLALAAPRARAQPAPPPPPTSQPARPASQPTAQPSAPPPAAAPSPYAPEARKRRRPAYKIAKPGELGGRCRQRSDCKAPLSCIQGICETHDALVAGRRPPPPSRHPPGRAYIGLQLGVSNVLGRTSNDFRRSVGGGPTIGLEPFRRDRYSFAVTLGFRVGSWAYKDPGPQHKSITATQTLFLIGVRGGLRITPWLELWVGGALGAGWAWSVVDGELRDENDVNVDEDGENRTALAGSLSAGLMVMPVRYFGIGVFAELDWMANSRQPETGFGWVGGHIGLELRVFVFDGP